MKLFLVLLFIIIADPVTNEPPSRRLFTFTKCECKFDLASVTALNCRMKAARNVFGVLTFLVTLKRPVNKFLVDIQSYRKGSSNIFSKGSVHMVVNLCEYDTSDRNLGLKFMPTLKEAYGLFVKKCPYQDQIGFANYTIDSMDKSMVLPFIPTGEYKVVLGFIDADLNRTIFDLAISVFYRGKSLSFMSS